MTKIIPSLSKTSKFTFIGFWAVAFVMNWTAPGNAFKKVNQTSWGVAIKGYDTVAYHTEGRAVKGQSKYSHEWNDAKWYFASAENRDLFAADPERYAPQYGGY
jgi:YHS domain-containing protein